MKPALLVIDVQKHYVFANEEKTKSIRNAVGSINAAVDLFRRLRFPVICIQHVDEAIGIVPGAEGFGLIEELAIVPEDIHIYKTYGNAFTKTPLQTTLKELGCDTIILTGYCAEYCVLSTCRGAVDHDITPIILRGGIASGIPAHVNFVENVNEVISFGALRKMLS